MIVVLSLRRSESRRKRMVAELAAAGVDGRVGIEGTFGIDGHVGIEALSGIQARFMDAVDAEELPSDAPPPPGLTPKEWACLETHRRAWTDVVTGGAATVILEDDVRLGPSFIQVLRELTSSPRGSGRPRADVILLGHHSARRGPDAGAIGTFRSESLSGGHRLARPAEFPMGAYAYYLTPAGARGLLAFSEPGRMSADWVVGYSPGAGVRLGMVTPPCVVPDPDVPSTIDDRPPSETAPGAAPRPGPRELVGSAWLFARRLGIAPGAYAWRAPRGGERPRAHQRYPRAHQR